EAAIAAAQSLALNRELGDRIGVAACLTLLAGVALERGRPADAARLLAAVQAFLDTANAQRFADGQPGRRGVLHLPIDRFEYDRLLALVRADVEEPTFAEAWAEGRALSLEVAGTEARWVLAEHVQRD